MITLRKAADRGHTVLNWLDSRHSFSFGDYHDPRHMGFSALRVLNDDRVAPGGGFPRHFHRNAEIFTYVISGALAHEDSMGNGSVIKAGNLQYMSAGDGVEHSEYNASNTEPVHFLQIWLLASERGGEPRYAEKQLATQEERPDLTLLFSGSGRANSVPIRQDAEIFLGVLSAGKERTVRLASGRSAWLQVVQGQITALGEILNAADGAAISKETAVRLTADSDSEFLLFDLP